jgi:hypothetical protein
MSSTARPESKRRRVDSEGDSMPSMPNNNQNMVCAEDVMAAAREMWRKDPSKLRSTQTEDTDFREMFGCGLLVFLSLWGMLVTTGLLPENGTFDHLLWTLFFLKSYGKERTMASQCGCDPKTFRLWVWLFIRAIAEMEPMVVSFLFDGGGTHYFYLIKSSFCCALY